MIGATITPTGTRAFRRRVMASSRARGEEARGSRMRWSFGSIEVTEILTAAMLTMMHARNVCHGGYVVDALAIYEGIIQSITPSPVLSSRPRSTEIQ